MSQEGFEKLIMSKNHMFKDDLPDMVKRGVISFIVRMCLTYPELAKKYYDKLQKTTMD